MVTPSPAPTISSAAAISRASKARSKWTRPAATTQARVDFAVPGEAEPCLEERLQVECWICGGHDGGWIVERASPEVIGTARNDHGFPCLRYPGATRDNLHAAFDYLEPFLCSGMVSVVSTILAAIG
jgi:hypothetical protein